MQSNLTANPAQQPPPVEGFLYNPRLLYAPNRYLPLALEGLIPYCNENYAHRWYTAPLDPTASQGASLIEPGETRDYQLRIVPGSVIVGARFCTLGTGGGAAPSPSLMQYLIRDSDTQKNFTDGKSRYISCNSLVPTLYSGAAFCIFPKPYLVTGGEDEDGGGVIVVSLSNISTGTSIMWQLLLYVMEPGQIETTDQSGAIMVPRAHEMAKPGRVGHNGHATHGGHPILSQRHSLTRGNR